MADRYWVGGTNTWNGTAGTKWATTSGGAGGAAVPTSSDDVFFDANSGVVTVTVSGSPACRHLNFTGFPSGAAITTGGIVTLVLGGDIIIPSGSLATYTFFGFVAPTASVTHTLDTNGVVHQFIINSNANNATINLASDWVTDSSTAARPSGMIFTGTGAVFNTNNYNMTLSDFNNGPAGTINLGSSIITLKEPRTGAGQGFVSLSGAGTVNFGTSKIILQCVGSNNRTFAGAGRTFYNLEITGSTSGNLVFTGSNTFNEFRCSIAPKTIHFTAGTTTTVSAWVVSGTPGNLITITSPTTATHALVKTGGIVSSDYLNLSYSAATPASTWYAGANSTNSGNNSGWLFSAGAFDFSPGFGSNTPQAFGLTPGLEMSTAMNTSTAAGYVPILNLNVALEIAVSQAFAYDAGISGGMSVSRADGPRAAFDVGFEFRWNDQEPLSGSWSKQSVKSPGWISQSGLNNSWTEQESET